MTSFAYRILPPRPELRDTIGSEEVAVLVRYLKHLEDLKKDGTVRFMGHAPNGDHNFMLVEARDEAHANTIARSDPAVSEGLMRIERHTSEGARRS